VSLKRQDIVDAIETRLKTILVTGGYHSDLGLNVFVWRRAPIEAHEVPAVNILDRETKLSGTGLKGATPLSTYEMTVEIQVAATGSAAPDTVRSLAADVYKAVGTDPTFSGKVLITTPIGDEMYAEHAGEVVADAVIRLSLLYRTDLFQET
jgi:hypothetical protein